MLDETRSQPDRFGYLAQKPGQNGEEKPLHVYPYGVSRDQLEHVLQVLSLPVVRGADVDSADAILTVRSHVCLT